MFDFLSMSDSTIVGGVIVVFVFAFVRFGNTIVDHLLSYQSSPVEAIEKTLPEQQ